MENQTTISPQRTVAVIGATGYIGGRLVPLLLQQGCRVRAVGRNPAKLECRAFATHPDVELIKADVMDRQSLRAALSNCQAAYYLVHSMYPGVEDFERRDRRAAETMRDAADDAGVERIIYLGGLGEEHPDLSAHLSSRMEVGRILGSGRAQLTWLRAAMILGSGSASFEILRYLVDRLPIMITPAWVRTLCQPIAVSNVLEYLAGCLDSPETAGRTFDIGGPDILSYRELFDVYAEVAGLRRRIVIPLPVLTPRLSSYWIQMVTPVPSSLSRPLAEGLRNKVVCTDNDIHAILPIRLLSAREAIQRALDHTVRHEVETCWSDAGQVRVPEWIDCGDARYAGGTVLESAHQVILGAPAHSVWQELERLGGAHGWLYADWLWRLRGFLDKLLGGIGLRRGRRDPDSLRPGDAVDFWRVQVADRDRRLRLLAEMKLPGDALLQFDLHETNPQQTQVVLRARFLPRGLWGILYWTVLLPVHGPLFRGMLRALAARTGAPLLDGPSTPDKENATCRL